MVFFKIAYGAGHYKGTAGKRLPAALDKNETREWVLNDRVARHFAAAAAEYEAVALLRVDDPTGEKDVTLQARCKAANDWGANFYLDIHHNAAGRVFDGGGIEAFAYKEGTKAATYRDVIYDACIAAGGLRGNRSQPKKAKGFYMLLHTKADAVLMEYGFMDSRTDAPVILSDAYAKKVAYATMQGIAKVAGLKKKEQVTQPVTNTNTKGVCSVNVNVLKKGAKGNDVKAMQLLLIGYGYKMENNGKTYGADGSFGAATDNALRAFQKANGLAVDGSCGAKTWAKLLGVS